MRPRRLTTFDYTGCHHYALTFCTYRRNRYFEDPALLAVVMQQISRTIVEHGFEELAYCYMPDHVHVLVAGLIENASFVPCIEVVRQRSSRAAKTFQGIRLWQDGYFERVIRADEQLDCAAAVSLNADALLTCQFMLEDHAVRHSYHHLAKIRAALNGSAV